MKGQSKAAVGKFVFPNRPERETASGLRFIFALKGKALCAPELQPRLNEMSN